jgi:hypothetical protein
MIVTKSQTGRALRRSADDLGLDGGVRVHSIGRPRRAEIPFELPSHRALAFGDTVLEIDGELRVWPRQRESERRQPSYEQRFLPSSTS